VSKDLTEKEREHMVHTKPPHERGGEREPFGDVYARAHMVNVLPSSSVDDISPHTKMCFSNFSHKGVIFKTKAHETFIQIPEGDTPFECLSREGLYLRIFLLGISSSHDL
jgi:hypothetical protein